MSLLPLGIVAVAETSYYWVASVVVGVAVKTYRQRAPEYMSCFVVARSTVVDVVEVVGFLC